MLDPDGRVAGIEPARTPGPGPAVEVLIPGLVNAHVHLDLSRLPGDESWRGFTGWLAAVVRARLRQDGGALAQAARRNLESLVSSGTTGLGDIDTGGAGRGALEERALPAVSYRELSGFDLDPDAAEALVARRLLPDSEPVRSGLSPHAPYSVSAALFRAARASGRPLAIHLAETEEECRFVRDGSGPFKELLESLGRWDPGFRAPGCSPLAWIKELGCLGRRTLLVHLQELLPGDLELLRASGSPVVVCPGTIAYFGRQPPRVRELLDAGVTVALGTDSLASNRRLSMLDEMAGLRRLCPELAPLEILRMATLGGARALGLEGVGRLRPGSRFDAVALRGAPPGERELGEWLCSGELGAPEVWVKGRSLGG